MRRIGIASALLLVAIMVIAQPAWAQTKSGTNLKSIMGENFQNIQLILQNLITSNYNNVPKEIKIIHKHAVDLGKTQPDFIKSDFSKRMFTNYAYRMESQAGNMLTVLEELIKRDQAKTKSGALNIDYLRVVAAQHFGEIITSCVLCHNQFRRKRVGG